VRYRIDRAGGTATLLEQITDPDAPASQWGGSTRKLPGGNWVVAWGHSTFVTEETPSGHFVVTLKFLNDAWSYRANPVLPGTLNPAALRRGMDRMAKEGR
jgi:hypothetical protein